MFTLFICLATLAVTIGYLARWARVDAIASASVSVVAAVSATGAVINAMTLWRERQ
jgi:hypothetical protein